MTRVDRQHLKTTSIRGAAVSMGAQGLKFALTFLNQVLLARMLLPEDFGLLAMVAPIVAFVQMFADLGLSQATIQRPNITQAQLSFLFWLNFAAAAGLAVTMIALSPLIGWFYHEPRVTMIAAVMGSTFLMSGLYTQHMAIFTRNMAFVKMALMDISAFIIGMVAGLVAASQGLHYWSLVIVHATIYGCNLLFAWSLSSWQPNRPRLPEDWRSLLNFGGNLTGANFVNYFSRNLDNVLIGKFKGEVALGYYDRAYKLLLLPLTQINAPFSRIAIPLLSRTQHEPELYRKAYLRMMEVLMLLIYPGVLFAIVTHDHLIRIVMGERWAGVAPIFGVLGLNAILQSFGYSMGWLFISQGRTREMRNYGIISSCFFVTSFVVGLPWGPLGVAIAYTSVCMVQGPTMWWLTTRTGPVRFSDMTGLMKTYLTACLICAGAIYGLDHYVLSPNIFSLAGMLIAAYLAFLGALFVLPSGRAILKELWRHARGFLFPLSTKFWPSRQQQGEIEN